MLSKQSLRSARLIHIFHSELNVIAWTEDNAVFADDSQEFEDDQQDEFETDSEDENSDE